ncbi:DVUA0089 family protein [Ideonella sp. A 288]|uniref:DVUA0089 family protein n=1 Tax=Ideonella sp. A 288 TaxID=1962181 RepID=UPI000B4BA763|nr:DVUA0089 family protein [Ideonella sp. A 288]
MHPTTTRLAVACTAALALAMTSAALAGTTHYSGAFAQDDDLFVQSFTLTSESQVRGVTTSFAQGAFAPVLTVFGPGGLLVQEVGSAHVCGAGSGAADAATGFCWDALFDTVLSGGVYTLVLSQDGNVALGGSLADGFTHDGQPDYTGVAYLGLPGAKFINVDGRERSSLWALDLSIDPTHLPEPASLGLMAAALALSLVGHRKAPRASTGPGQAT